MISINKRFLIFKHIAAGIAVGYFLLHPITMLIYMIDFHSEHISTITDYSLLLKRVLFSFEPGMIVMSLFFIILGGILGLITGIYEKNSLKKELIIENQLRELSRNINFWISMGESETVEFKSTLRWDLKLNKINKDIEHSILKTIAGFANNKGGNLLIGVDDKSQIVGLQFDYDTLKKPNRDGFEQHLINLITNRLGIENCTLLHISFHEVEEKEICQLIIDPSPKPVYLQEGERVMFYLRTGNSTQELNPRQIVEYVSSKKVTI